MSCRWATARSIELKTKICVLKIRSPPNLTVILQVYNEEVSVCSMVLKVKELAESNYSSKWNQTIVDIMTNELKESYIY
jgi:hypothetical protein